MLVAGPLTKRSPHGKENKATRMDQRECSRIENTCASENTSGEDCALAQEDCCGNTPEGISTGRVDGFAGLVGSLIVATVVPQHAQSGAYRRTTMTAFRWRRSMTYSRSSWNSSKS